MTTSARCHHSFALLRSPLLPIDQLLARWQGIAESDHSQLAEWFSHPLVDKALYVASPTLYQIWQDWREGVTTTPTSAAQMALWRYVIRMSSRCTPFGLLAGVSAVKVTECTCGDIASDTPVLSVRPDMEWLTALISAIEQHPAIRWQLRYRPNNSLYQLGSQYRYSDYTTHNGQRAFFINAIEGDELLDTVLAQTRRSSQGVSGVELIDFICREFGETTEEATRYVDELFSAHVLFSELVPGITGKSPLDHVLSVLRGVPAAASLAGQLERLREVIGNTSLPVSQLKCIQPTMRMLLGDACPPGDMLQTDMVRSADRITINERVVTQIGQQLTQLLPLRADHRTDNLDSFAQRYYARYSGQPQPLLVALDHESGIGYGPKMAQGGVGQSSLLQQLNLQQGQVTTVVNDGLDTLRLNLLTSYLKTGQCQQAITDADLIAITHMPASTAAPAQSWSALGELYAANAESIDRDDYQFLLKSASGPSAASLMARFSTLDESLRAGVLRITDWEANQQPNAILAELVHMPAGRIGNVVCRPTLRSFEIPYLTPSSVDEEHTLMLSDLWVRVPDGKTIELWSEKHNKRVLPRNTTAHNYHGSDDVYRFLSDLSHQDGSLSLRWSWGAFADQPALPRVTYERIILARAQWNLTKQSHWTSATDMAMDLDQTTSLPRYVALVEADNELLLDLKVNVCQQMLYTELVKRKTVRVVEWLATPDNCWLTRSGHRYTSELVIPFKSATPALSVRQSPFRLDEATAVQRTFLPGSEWLYVNVYVGEQTADEVLCEVVKPFVATVQQQGLVDHWFFVRYHDPNPHLRLRFHCQQEASNILLSSLRQALQPWVDTGRVNRVQVDTYERELERYGPRTIALCEQVFWQDSEWTLRWLAIRDDFDEDQQWWVACRRANQLLDAFKLSHDEKIELMIGLQTRFLVENSAKSDLRKQLNEQYRTWQSCIQQQDSSIRERVTELVMDDWPIVIQLRETIDRYPSAGPTRSELIIALLHMLFNRFFTSAQRLSEGVVYHFMSRQLTSEKARTK